MTSQLDLSPIKQFAVKVLEKFDELARPEIQNVIIAKVWDYVKSYTLKIIQRKPDEELKDKLLQIHLMLKKEFDDIDMSLGIKAGEALGSPIIPNLGEIKRIRGLTSDNIKTNKLLEELGF